MAISEENILQIERYIDGEMTVDERAQFEQLISENAEVKASLEEHQLMVQALRETERTRLRTELKTMLKESTGKGEKVSLNTGRKKLYWVAAAILFLLGSFFVYNLLINQNPSAQSLFDEYYTAYNRVQVRDAGEGAEQVLSLYGSGDYATALPKLEALVSSQTSPGQYSLLLASCYLSLDQPADALEVLKPLMGQNVLLSNHARWYIMLSHLKLGDLSEARRLLEEITTSGDDYSQTGKRLLSQLPS